MNKSNILKSNNDTSLLNELQELYFDDDVDLLTTILDENDLHVDKEPLNSSNRKHRLLKKSPDAPKRFKTAYICFVKDKMEEVKKGLQDVPDCKVTDSMKVLALMWKNLSPLERMNYESMAEVDKSRYFDELAQFQGPLQIPNKRKRKERDAPKRSMSAFLIFSQSFRQSLLQENPHLKNTEISSILATRWRSLTEEEKQPYLIEERREREIYHKEMKEYKEKKLQDDICRLNENIQLKNSQNDNNHFNSNINFSQTLSTDSFDTTKPSKIFKTEHFSAPLTTFLPKESSSMVIAPSNSASLSVLPSNNTNNMTDVYQLIDFSKSTSNLCKSHQVSCENFNYNEEEFPSHHPAHQSMIFYPNWNTEQITNLNKYSNSCYQSSSSVKQIQEKAMPTMVNISNSQPSISSVTMNTLPLYVSTLPAPPNRTYILYKPTMIPSNTSSIPSNYDNIKFNKSPGDIYPTSTNFSNSNFNPHIDSSSCGGSSSLYGTTSSESTSNISNYSNPNKLIDEYGITVASILRAVQQANIFPQ